MGFKLTILVVIGTDCKGNCKSNYHTIMTTTATWLKTSIIVVYVVVDSQQLNKAMCITLNVYYVKGGFLIYDLHRVIFLLQTNTIQPLHTLINLYSCVKI